MNPIQRYPAVDKGEKKLGWNWIDGYILCDLLVNLQGLSCHMLLLLMQQLEIKNRRHGLADGSIACRLDKMSRHTNSSQRLTKSPINDEEKIVAPFISWMLDGVHSTRISVRGRKRIAARFISWTRPERMFFHLGPEQKQRLCNPLQKKKIRPIRCPQDFSNQIPII